MKKRKIVYSIFAVIILLVAITYSLESNFNRKPSVIEQDSLPVEETPDDEIVDTEQRLTCFDFIDKQLNADGFTYLENAKWGRGENNFFLIDIVTQEFQMADSYYTKNLKADWYSVSYERYVSNVYIHSDRQIWSYYGLMNGQDKVNIFEPNSAAAYATIFLGTGGYYQELPVWMDYYIEQTNKYGCSLSELSNEKLLDEFKTKQSTAKSTDVISVFDRKSDDGVLRYFADVHVKGAIEDNPRYKELSSYEEYLEIQNVSDYENMYFINMLYHNPTKNLFEQDNGYIQSSIIKEFTKDVIFTQTTWINDKPGVETFGVYFIYVDNPNGNFKHMYTKPYKNAANWVYSSFDSFKNIESPYEGSILRLYKGDVNGPIYPLQVNNFKESLRWYLYFLEDINPGIKYSEDFISNYTRPFNYSWQKGMGLKEHFDKKYGFINRDIQYNRLPMSGY